MITRESLEDQFANACRILYQLGCDQYLFSLASYRDSRGEPRMKRWDVGFDEDDESISVDTAMQTATHDEMAGLLIRTARAIYGTVPEVGAVFCIFPPLASAFAGSAASLRKFPPIGHQGAAFAPEIQLMAVMDDAEALAQAIASKIGGRGLVLCEDGGAWIVTNTIAQAVVVAGSLVRALELQALAMVFAGGNPAALVVNWEEAAAKAGSLFFLNKADETFGYLRRSLVEPDHA